MDSGSSARVIREGCPVHLTGRNSANFDHGTHAGPATIFLRIGCVSMQATADTMAPRVIRARWSRMRRSSGPTPGFPTPPEPPARRHLT